MERLVRIGLSRRVPRLTRAAAQAYWRTVHADLFSAVPRLVSYVQNHAVLIDEDHALIDDCPFDVFAEVTFETEQDLAEASASEYYRTVVLQDEANLLLSEGRSFLLLRRNACLPPVQLGSIRLVAFLSDSCKVATGGLAPTIQERIEVGSGPIGRRARFYAQWHCSSAQDALVVYEALLGQECFAENHLAATVVRPTTVVGPATPSRLSAI